MTNSPDMGKRLVRVPEYIFTGWSKHLCIAVQLFGHKVRHIASDNRKAGSELVFTGAVIKSGSFAYRIKLPTGDIMYGS